uniref:Heparanase-like n=1 Tax=Sinocyclocheilus grahami TaxID=75366 RepID=A0A672NXG7_SINGR
NQSATKGKQIPALPLMLKKNPPEATPAVTSVRYLNKFVMSRFLSVAIDASLIAEERFMNLLNSPKLRTLAKALVPAFLRFGGTKQDFMTFNPRGRYFQARDNSNSAVLGNLCHKRLELPPLLENRLKQEWVLQSKTLLQEELEGKYKRSKFSGKFNLTSLKLLLNKEFIVS